MPPRLKISLNAVGQYILYQNALELLEPERELYLAIRQNIYAELFGEVLGQILLDKKQIKLIVFDAKAEVIVRWIS